MSGGQERVAESDAGVSVSGRVEDDPVAIQARRVNRVDELAFVIALKGAQLDAPPLRVGGQVRLYLVERGVSVHFGFAHAQEVEVWAIEQEYSH